ncbi:MAG: thioesterase [Desulfobacterium sp.]|nr:thioesterase [Desulfobacterium sp.]
MNKPNNISVPVRLFCLPFAGGSYYSYYPLEKHMDPRIGLTPIDLPGHGRRMQEPLLGDLDDMCTDIYDRIRDQLHVPYGILGHSMGATLGYLLAQKIIDRGAPRPLHLFASGRQGPPVPSRMKDVHLLPKPDFIKHLQLYGGIPDSVLGEKELLDLFEPILRADFKALGNYTYQKETPLAVPITVFLGTADTTTYEEALTWQAVTTTKICIHRFSGDHFFIFDHLQDMGRMISETVLTEAGLPVPG